MKTQSLNSLWICLFLAVGHSTSTFAQVSNTGLNQTDKQGRKQGLWIENDGQREVYYRDGLRDGIFKSYYKINGKLEGLGWFKQGKLTGDWYYFDQSGRLLMTEQGIVRNTVTVKRADGVSITPGFASYFKAYHKNGALKEEGKALYNESIELEDYLKTGTWKYYDEEGKLIKEENIKGGK